jgi:hypothetical protein
MNDYLERDNATQTLGAFGLALVIFLWGYYRFLAGPNLDRIPRAGKGPGWFGLSLVEAKRDFLKNGPKIINEGYNKVRRIHSWLSELY